MILDMITVPAPCKIWTSLKLKGLLSLLETNKALGSAEHNLFSEYFEY